jgi:hypothetical protein
MLRGLDPNDPDYISKITKVDPKLGFEFAQKQAAAKEAGLKTTGLELKNFTDSMSQYRNALDMVRTPEQLLAWQEAIHKDPITGRCVKDVAPPLVGNAGLLPCPAGTVRNPVTGRCVKATGPIGRRLTAAAHWMPTAAVAVPAVAAAKPCPAGKVLNPKTGRCVNATGGTARAAGVAPCPPGYGRHPRTRKCVRITAGGTRRRRY